MAENTRKRLLIFIPILVIIFIISFDLIVRQINKPLPLDVNLTKISLGQKDVPQLKLMYQSRIDAGRINPNSYSWLISYFQGEGENKKKSLMAKVYIYDSQEKLSMDFVKTTPEFLHEINVKKIGSESFAYSGDILGVKSTTIIFKKKNVIVTLNFNGGTVDEAVNYAKLIERKI